MARKTGGWALLICGALIFLYGVLTTVWFITIAGGIIVGVGWATVFTARH